MRVVAVAVHRGHAAIDDVAAMLQEPREILAEDCKRLDPLLFEAFDGVERNQSDQGPNTKWNRRPVWKAQQVVEKPILLVPQRAIAANHLHGRADVDVMLEEFRRQSFVN